jgi:hypothetical protein
MGCMEKNEKDTMKGVCRASFSKYFFIIFYILWERRSASQSIITLLHFQMIINHMIRYSNVEAMNRVVIRGINLCPCVSGLNHIEI